MMTIPKKLRAIMDALGMTQVELADRLGVAQSSVNRWLSGDSDPRGTHRDAINELYDHSVESGSHEELSAHIPIMGYVGAGAEVDPDFEQVPAEGLDQISVPFTLPDDMIAFQVRGDSMLPMFDDGMVIVVFKEQRRALETFYGDRALVRTADGRRYVKTIMKGNDGRASLLSWNAKPIQDVEIVWVGEIFTYFPASAIRREARRADRQGGLQGSLKLKAV